MEVEKQNFTSDNNESLSKEQVEKAWKNFVQTLDDEKTSSEFSLLQNRVIFVDVDEKDILVCFENSIQSDNFNAIKTDLLMHLRKSLKNDFITVTTQVKQQETTHRRLYTANDKLEYLISKNPEIKILKDKLGLDIDL